MVVTCISSEKRYCGGMRSNRHSLRLPGYDYRRPDPYYFTACTKHRECLFGEIHDGIMHSNVFGRITQACWDELPRHFSNVILDKFTLMPNHVHGVFWIVDGPVDGVPSVGMTHASSLPVRTAYARSSDHVPFPARGPKPGSVGVVIGSFKSAVSRLINKSRGLPGAPVWQYNYHERIIRTQESLERIRHYIDLNPENWGRDRNYVHSHSQMDRATATLPAPDPAPEA